MVKANKNRNKMVPQMMPAISVAPLINNVKSFTDVQAFNPPKLSRKSAKAMRAIAELHLALNCPNEVAFINTIRSSSTINFPYPLELKRYYYRIYLVENPCVMTKPKNYYLQPSIKRQLCIDVAWFLSHHGLVPMLVMIVHYSNYYR